MTIYLFHKKILGIGGAEKFLFDFAKTLIKSGIRVKLITFENKLHSPEELKDDIIVLSGIVHLVQFALFNRGLYICSYGEIELFICSILTQNKYFLQIHQPSTMTFKPDYKQTLLFRHKAKYFVNQSQWLKLNTYYDNYSTFKKFKHECKSYLQYCAQYFARQRFVLSDYAVEEKKNIFGLSTIKLQAALFEEDLDQKLPNLKDIEFLLVARLDENKRIIETLELFSSYIKTNKNRNCNLCIVGDGPLMAVLKNRIIDLDLNERVTLTGFIEQNQLDDLFSRSKVLLALDWADYRLTMFEALSWKCAVAVSNDAEVPEAFMSAGVVQRLTPDNDHTNFKRMDQLLTLMDDQTYDFVKLLLQEYTWERYVSRLMDFIE